MAARWRAPSRCEEGVIRHKRAPVAFFVHPHSQPAPLRLINSCQCIFLGTLRPGRQPMQFVVATFALLVLVFVMSGSIALVFAAVN